MSFVRHLIKKRIAAFVRRIADWAFFIGAVLIGGIGSSWYMVEAGTSLTTESEGAWVMWRSAGRADADPYTRAHFARLGALPLSTEIGETFMARTDDEGGSLHSSCDYAIEGKARPATWWSVSVFDAAGKIIPNAAGRQSFTSDTLAIGPDGQFRVVLARSASPGNWLPTGGAGRLAVVLTRIDWGVATGTGDERAEGFGLPTITRKACR